MKTNEYNECILDESDIIDGLYSEKINSLSEINIENEKLIQDFNNSLKINFDSLEELKEYKKPTENLETFDLKNQKSWLIPEKYKNFDIETWIIDQCTTEIQKNRVLEEINLFKKHNMIDVLVCLKYIVDFMREHNILWGVGRGSSVASYCLFLIGIHKIDSIKFNLDINEFLKGD